MPRPRLPYFPFWANDFLIDPVVSVLDYEERGILTTLWCYMWMNDVKRGTLLVTLKRPMSDEEIASLLRLNLEKWKQVKERLVSELGILEVGKRGELFSKRQANFKSCKPLFTPRKLHENSTKTPGFSRPESESYSESESESKPKTLSPLFLQRVEKLKTLILQNNPSAKVKDSKWGDVVRLMVERDKRTLEEIDEVIEWSQGDDFWKTNILSMGAVKRQFDKLTMQMKKSKRGRESNICPTCRKLMADCFDHWYCGDCRQKFKKEA